MSCFELHIFVIRALGSLQIKLDQAFSSFVPFVAVAHLKKQFCAVIKPAI